MSSPAERPLRAVPAPADWTSQVADRIEGVVELARTRAVRPLTVVAKALVYGLVALVMLTVVIVLGAVAVVRALNIVLPDWLSEVAVGGFFALGGLFLLLRSRRGR